MFLLYSQKNPDTKCVEIFSTLRTILQLPNTYWVSYSFLTT